MGFGSIELAQRLVGSVSMKLAPFNLLFQPDRSKGRGIAPVEIK